MDIQKIINTLVSNKDKPFVKRILNPDRFPVLENADGTFSAHSMATAEVDGRFFAYPTVLMTNGGQLKRFEDDEAWRNIVKTNNFIEFDSQEEADFFAENYKSVWRK